jgi:hypothetical protein
MAKKEVPKLFEYWKAPTITEEDLTAFHGTRGLPGVVLCSTTPLEFQTIDRTVIVCFESHLMCGLSLPPRKFLVSILNYLECELVHLNPNAIAMLKCFSMLCECWLDIPPDTSLFWYFYYPARYECKVFSGIELTLHHNHQGEYLKTKFRGCWKGASRRWFHVDIHNTPQWPNKHLLPPLVEKKGKEPKMTPCLMALIKRVTEFHRAELEACHCAEEFTLRQIRSLDRREKLASECP